MYESIQKAYDAGHELVQYGIEKKIISKDYKFYGLSRDALEYDYDD